MRLFYVATITLLFAAAGRAAEPQDQPKMLPPKELKPGESIVLAPGQVFVYGATKAVMQDGTAILYDYITTVPLDDPRDLCEEVEKIWTQRLRKATEEAGFSNPLFRATNGTFPSKSAADRVVYTIGYLKGPDGVWNLQHCQPKANVGRMLKFGKYDVKRIVKDGVVSMVINGSITNPTTNIVTVPNLKLTLSDTSVAKNIKIFAPPRNRIESGATIYLEMVYENPSPDATQFDVRFTDDAP